MSSSYGAVSEREVGDTFVHDINVEPIRTSIPSSGKRYQLMAVISVVFIVGMTTILVTDRGAISFSGSVPSKKSDSNDISSVSYFSGTVTTIAGDGVNGRRGFGGMLRYQRL